MDARLSDGQEAMILEDDGLVRAEVSRDLVGLLGGQNDSSKGRVDGAALIELERVLGDEVRKSAEGGEGGAVDRVRVADGEDVGSGRVDFGVDDLQKEQRYVPSARARP